MAALQGRCFPNVAANPADITDQEFADRATATKLYSDWKATEWEAYTALKRTARTIVLRKPSKPDYSDPGERVLPSHILY